ncbi:sigma-70 family RNA polymerase sigma factor [Streptomyces sp. BPTC-684]|uniref:RNA polymerase sigma factor n=1 Tax=Streptomyces sp. BPTC-684 TaxID=3043734 RepID=UPI0024B0411D|nr:sigma-70 family RNA polymerase sigma factor [Streptomyces sp. BPTC-684]WHM41122.1 sigma-70 family RNA polymerase sigma factor [Streptomyces sp. BPTC-684]
MKIGDHWEDPQEGGTSETFSTTGESAGPAATQPGLTSGHEEATHAAGEKSFDLRGDFGQYCEENTPRLLRVAFRITRDPWAAEDALQNVLEKFWKRWPEAGFRDRVLRTPGYSNSCVVYSAIDAIRSEASRAFREEQDASKEVVRSDDYLRVEDDDSFRRMLDVLNSLNRTWRLVIYLRYAREFTIVEVAAIIQISESTARRYERRALMALREAYQGN